MAETKAKPKSKAKAKSRATSKSKPGASGSKSNSSKSGATAKPKKRASSKSSRSKSAQGKSAQGGKPQAALEAVESTAKDVGGAVGSAASKVGEVASTAKVPLVAGGAALAGAAGGLALGARGAHRKGPLGKGALPKVRSKDLAKAAKKAGEVGAQVGEIALEVKRAREATNGNGRHRSPIEVVLEGLTSRGPRG